MNRGRGAERGAGGEYERAERAAKSLRRRTRLRPHVGLVLGSGLGAFAGELERAVKIPYGEIPISRARPPWAMPGSS